MGSLTRSVHTHRFTPPCSSFVVHSPPTTGTTPFAVSRERWMVIVDASGNIRNPKAPSDRQAAVTQSASCPPIQRTANTMRDRVPRSITDCRLSGYFFGGGRGGGALKK